MSKITVIVPVYKVEQYLHKCVDSILSQSFRDFDLVLVDDGSPDSCPAICDEYAAKDRRVKVIHKQNGGLSDARNAGIDWAMEHSDSEWLAFVDSDDYIHPDYLKSLFNTAQEESADLVICDFARVNDQEEIIEYHTDFFDLSTSDKSEIFECLSNNWRIVTAVNKLYAKSIFVNLRFPFGKIHEDEYVIHQVLWKSTRVAFIHRELYYYRFREDSIMANESSASKLDGFEAAILQYEFCLERHLPPRSSAIHAEYLNSVMDLRKGLNEQEKKRYHSLKRRYSKLYFSVKENHSIKGYSLYYFNALCRMVRRFIK